MEFLVIWLLFAVLTGFIASQKGHSFLVWFFVGLLGGIFGAVGAMFLKEKTGG